jgi:hypothetical protein
VPVSIKVDGRITVGNQIYNPTQNAGIHIVTLQRQPVLIGKAPVPIVIADHTFTTGEQVSNYLQSVKPDGDIVLVSAFGNAPVEISTFAKDLEGFGATNEFENIGELNFTFAGNGGLQQGQAHQAALVDLNGYLAQDSNKNYLFIQPDHVRFDLTTDGTIKIITGFEFAADGSINFTFNPYTKESGGCSSSAGGVTLAVLDRGNPQDNALVKDTRAYCTNTGDGNQDETQLNALATDLGKYSQDEGALVFLASWGSPVVKPFGDPAVTAVAFQVRQLGGYYETFADLGPKDTYTLVGSAPPPNGIPGARNRGRESSTLYPGHLSGELHGALARTRRGNWYSPITGDPSGFANLELYSFIGNAPTPFPHPVNSDEQAAFRYINDQLCKSTTCNIRDSYWDTAIPVTNYQNPLQDMQDPHPKDPNSPDCPNPAPGPPAPSLSPFCIVRQQLLTELDDVATVRALNNNLDIVWALSGTDLTLNLLDVYTRVNDEIQPKSSNAASMGENFFNTFLGIGWALPIEGAPVFGILDELFSFGATLITDLQGNSTASQNTTVEQLYEKTLANYIAQGGTRGAQFDLIYEDWGRLHAIGQSITTMRPGWTWNGDTTASQILKALSPAIERSFYRSLMTAHFAIGRYVPGEGYNPDYLSSAPIYYGYTDYYSGAHPFAWYIPYTYVYDPNPYSDNGYTMLDGPTQTLLTDSNAWLGISTLTTDRGENDYNPPSPDTMAHLFQLSTDPIAPGHSTESLGVYRPDFFEGWEFPRVICAPNGQLQPKACDWGGATPPPESFPAPVASLHATVDQGPHQENAVTVHLTLTNNGSLDLQNIVLNQVSLRVLAGNGNARILDQTFPMLIGDLSVGTSQTIQLKLETLATINRLQLTESGTMQNNAGATWSFSQGHVVFP